MFKRIIQHPLFNFLITLGILTGLFFLIKSREKDLKHLFESVPGLNLSDYLLLFICLLLSALNWLLESLKWKILSKPLQEISFASAIRATLAGIGSGMLAPKSIGDVFGRLLFSNYIKKERLIGAILLSRIAQIAFSFGGGLVGLFILISLSRGSLPFLEEIKRNTLISVSVACIILVVFFFMLKTRRGQKIFRKYLIVIRLYTFRQILQVFIYSGLRYMVFILPFYLSFIAFGAQAAVLLLLAGSSLVLFLRSVIVSFNIFSDFGIRQIGALLIFGFIGVPEGIILSATIFIWLTNIVLPSLVGTFFIATKKSGSN